MFDFGGDVERQFRELRMHGAGDAQRMPGSIEEIGIAEGDMFGAGGDLVANVREHDVFRDDEEAPVIHRRDRAVRAQV